MEQYIPKSALVAEIEKLKGKISDGSSYCNGWQHALRMLELELKTLEVKEVDFEKYYHEFLQKEWFENPHVRTVSEMMVFTAKHFFELGLKVQKA